MPVLMRSCVHAEMRMGTRGRAECRCASTALLVGKRGLAAEARALVHSRHGPLSVAGASCLHAGCGGWTKHHSCYTGGFRVLG